MGDDSGVAQGNTSLCIQLVGQNFVSHCRRLTSKGEFCGCRDDISSFASRLGIAGEYFEIAWRM